MVRTDVFDGPLELLLFLVRRQAVDVREIRIAPIADDYLAQLQAMEVLDLDIAGEFLVMAATLIFLKSRELLPRPEPALGDEDDSDEAQAIREELTRRLRDYQRYKEAAEKLAERPWLGRDEFAPSPPEVRADEQPVDPGVDAMGLLQIFAEVLCRLSSPDPVHEVERETVSLAEMANRVLERLASGPRELTDLLGGLARRADRLVAFLATLELARLQLIDVRQAHHLGPVVLIRRSSTPAELSAVVGDAG